MSMSRYHLHVYYVLCVAIISAISSNLSIMNSVPYVDIPYVDMAAMQADVSISAISSNVSIMNSVPYVDTPYVDMAAMQADVNISAISSNVTIMNSAPYVNISYVDMAAMQADVKISAIASNVSIASSVPYVDIPYVDMAAIQDVPSTGDMELPDIMDEVVRLLLPPKRAEEYIRQHPSRNFSFFVYDDLPSELTWQHNSKCLETKLNTLDKKNKKNESSGQISNCDWGSSICKQVNSSTSAYSKRRFNRNGDVVMAKALLEYYGPLRTYDPTKADVFVVPYPSSAHCACYDTKFARCRVKDHVIQSTLFDKLAYLNSTTVKRHVFFTSGQSAVSQPLIAKQPLLVALEPHKHDCPSGKNCGRISMPYVNTNPEYQPDEVFRRLSMPPKNRTYALAAVMSTKIETTYVKNVRAEFMDVAESIMTSYDNQTSGGIAGMPIMVTGLMNRSLSDESDILGLYQDAIFCPCFKGDTPAQKRIFDALLSGCIPVTLEYSSFEKGYPSHFERKGSSIRNVYPFARGSFYGDPEMGIDYGQIVVGINGTCGIPCLVPVLEDLLLNHRDKIREMQENIGRVARLFSFGMERNSLKHVDAIAAMLVKIHHYVVSA
jgi:hypothetical protein